MDTALYNKNVPIEELRSSLRRIVPLKLPATPGRLTANPVGATGLWAFYGEDGVLDHVMLPQCTGDVTIPREGPEECPIRFAHRMADEQGRGKAQCYFIGGDVGAIKIGYSVSPNDRLKAIQAHSPIPVRILAVSSGGPLRESAYHNQFAIHRLHGEWFSRVPEIEAEIARLNSLPHPQSGGARA